MFFNTYQQSKNVFDLQFKSSQQQSYRFDNVYSNNQYQNRQSYNQQSYDQRFHLSSIQRVYIVDDDQKNKFKKIYQNYQNDYDYDYQSKKEFEKIFHEHVDEKQSLNEIFVVDEKIRSFFTAISKCIFNCRRCDEKFFFNNKLYYHLRRCKKIINFNFDKNKSKIFYNLITITFSTRRVIRFIAFSNFAFDFEFRLWRYVKMKTNINSITSKILNDICIDNDAEFSMTNRNFLTIKISNYVSKILQKKKSLKINDIDFVVVKINEYLFIDFTISNEMNEKTINVTFTRHIYIVKNLKTNIFLNNDILKLKNIVFHVDKKKSLLKIAIIFLFH